MFLWLVPISLQQANSANYGRNVMCTAVATNYLPSSNFALQSSEMRKSEGGDAVATNLLRGSMDKGEKRV